MWHLGIHNLYISSQVPGMSPQQLTALNLDKTCLLRDILQKHLSNADDLLGELQFSFLAFLMGQSLEGSPLLKHGICSDRPHMMKYVSMAMGTSGFC